MIIETMELTKSYGSHRGIEKLNLRVGEGELFGFIGPNGAGKSTTVRTLLGLLKPTSGSAKVFGYDCWAQRQQVLRQVGYLPSEVNFWSGMQAHEIITLSARLHGLDCAREAKYLCDRLELDTSKKAEELSLGNRKKVGIVCALQHSPALYILDEPTSGLDPLMQKVFFDLLQERRKAGATVFLSSHILSEIQRFCTKAAIIKDGRIIACDSVENLKQTGAKRVSLTGISNELTLAGVKDVKLSGDNMTFLYSGEMGALIHMLDGMPIGDMTITEPSLDEIFLHYYQEDTKEESQNGTLPA